MYATGPHAQQAIPFVQMNSLVVSQTPASELSVPPTLISQSLQDNPPFPPVTNNTSNASSALNPSTSLLTSAAVANSTDMGHPIVPVICAPQGTDVEDALVGVQHRYDQTSANGGTESSKIRAAKAGNEDKVTSRGSERRPVKTTGDPPGKEEVNPQGTRDLKQEANLVPMEKAHSQSQSASNRSVGEKRAVSAPLQDQKKAGTVVDESPTPAEIVEEKSSKSRDSALDIATTSEKTMKETTVSEAQVPTQSAGISENHVEIASNADRNQRAGASKGRATDRRGLISEGYEVDTTENVKAGEGETDSLQETSASKKMASEITSLVKHDETDKKSNGPSISRSDPPRDLGGRVTTAVRDVPPLNTIIAVGPTEIFEESPSNLTMSPGDSEIYQESSTKDSSRGRPSNIGRNRHNSRGRKGNAPGSRQSTKSSKSSFDREEFRRPRGFSIAQEHTSSVGRRKPQPAHPDMLSLSMDINPPRTLFETDPSIVAATINGEKRVSPVESPISRENEATRSFLANPSIAPVDHQGQRKSGSKSMAQASQQQRVQHAHRTSHAKDSAAFTPAIPFADFPPHPNMYSMGVQNPVPPGVMPHMNSNLIHQGSPVPFVPQMAGPGIIYPTGMSFPAGHPGHPLIMPNTGYPPPPPQSFSAAQNDSTGSGSYRGRRHPPKTFSDDARMHRHDHQRGNSVRGQPDSNRPFFSHNQVSHQRQISDQHKGESPRSEMRHSPGQSQSSQLESMNTSNTSGYLGYVINQSNQHSRQASNTAVPRIPSLQLESPTSQTTPVRSEPRISAIPNLEGKDLCDSPTTENLASNLAAKQSAKSSHVGSSNVESSNDQSFYERGWNHHGMEYNPYKLRLSARGLSGEDVIAACEPFQPIAICKPISSRQQPYQHQHDDHMYCFVL